MDDWGRINAQQSSDSYSGLVFLALAFFSQSFRNCSMDRSYLFSSSHFFTLPFQASNSLLQAASTSCWQLGPRSAAGRECLIRQDLRLVQGKAGNWKTFLRVSRSSLIFLASSARFLSPSKVLVACRAFLIWEPTPLMPSPFLNVIFLSLKRLLSLTLWAVILLNGMMHFFSYSSLSASYPAFCSVANFLYFSWISGQSFHFLLNSVAAVLTFRFFFPENSSLMKRAQPLTGRLGGASTRKALFLMMYLAELEVYAAKLNSGDRQMRRNML